jgi:hypothetical protein
MDQVLNKVGSYWFSKRANKEIDSIGNDISVSACAPASGFLPLYLSFSCILSPAVLGLQCLEFRLQRRDVLDLSAGAVVRIFVRRLESCGKKIP